MPRSKRMKLPEFVVEMIQIGSKVLMEGHGVTLEQAEATMRRVAREVCFRNAYSVVYIPEASAMIKLERNAQIWMDYQRDGTTPPYNRRFTPQRALELAQIYDLSPQQIYSILRAERESELATVMDQLPGMELPG